MAVTHLRGNGLTALVKINLLIIHLECFIGAKSLTYLDSLKLLLYWLSLNDLLVSRLGIFSGNWLEKSSASQFKLVSVIVLPVSRNYWGLDLLVKWPCEPCLFVTRWWHNNATCWYMLSSWGVEALSFPRWEDAVWYFTAKERWSDKRAELGLLVLPCKRVLLLFFSRGIIFDSWINPYYNSFPG